MEEKYYDKWRFKQIFKLCPNSPTEAKRLFEEYLEDYPKDYSAFTYYVYPLTILGELESAKKVLNYIEEKMYSDSYYLKYTDRLRKIEEKILYDRIRILFYEENFSEAYNMICSLGIEKIWDKDVEMLKFYCKKKLGILTETERNQDSYILKQIFEYREVDFLDHLKTVYPLLDGYSENSYNGYRLLAAPADQA